MTIWTFLKTGKMPHEFLCTMTLYSCLRSSYSSSIGQVCYQTIQVLETFGQLHWHDTSTRLLDSYKQAQRITLLSDMYILPNAPHDHLAFQQPSSFTCLYMSINCVKDPRNYGMLFRTSCHFLSKIHYPSCKDGKINHRLKFLMVKLIYNFNSKRGYGAAISNLVVYE